MNISTKPRHVLALAFLATLLIVGCADATCYTFGGGTPQPAGGVGGYGDQPGDQPGAGGASQECFDLADAWKCTGDVFCVKKGEDSRVCSWTNHLVYADSEPGAKKEANNDCAITLGPGWGCRERATYPLTCTPAK